MSAKVGGKNCQGSNDDGFEVDNDEDSLKPFHNSPLVDASDCLMNIQQRLIQVKMSMRLGIVMGKASVLMFFTDQYILAYRGNGSDSAVISSAIDIAKRSGIRISSKGFENFIDIGTALGVGSLLSLSISPWISAPSGVATSWLLKNAGTRFTRQINSHFSCRGNC